MTGELYAGRFSVDNQWYRVQICSVDRDKIDILFVDFGNTETTSLDQLRVLEQSLEKYPKQVRCTDVEWRKNFVLKTYCVGTYVDNQIVHKK